MMRTLAILLLGLNLALLVWGWSQDKPIDDPLPPLPPAPFKISLLSEQAADKQDATFAGGLPSPTAKAPVAATPPAAPAPVASGTSFTARTHGASTAAAVGTPVGREPSPIRVTPAPVSAYDAGAFGAPTRAPLPETFIERVDPNLLPEELGPEPPIVKPPVREDDLGATPTWSR